MTKTIMGGGAGMPEAVADRLRRGFTLLEVMVATIILSLGLVALITAFMQCQRIMRGSRQSVSGCLSQRCAKRQGYKSFEPPAEMSADRDRYGWHN